MVHDAVEAPTVGGSRIAELYRHDRLDTAATLRCMAEAAEREMAAGLLQVSTASAELGSTYPQTLSGGP
jgi:hypothetical protein